MWNNEMTAKKRKDGFSKLFFRNTYTVFLSTLVHQKKDMN